MDALSLLDTAAFFGAIDGFEHRIRQVFFGISIGLYAAPSEAWLIQP